jgi:glyoxylase-like metal-dependent hydrolase (beta-lactamase superfamily II)
MRRGGVLGILVAAGALSIALGAHQQPAADAKTVEVEKLKDNLFVLRGRGGGGNTAVFVQSGGVTVVDTKNPGWGEPILDAIRKLTDKPVTTIINTHTHGDHVSGNVAFPAAVEIVTHENTRSNMQKMSAVAPSTPNAKPNVFSENPGKGLPKRTFKDRLTLGKGADQVDLYYFGRGHTNGDAFVVFPSLRVMHAGDMFPGKNMPFMDATNGGSGLDYPATLMKAHRGVRNVDTIISGHSTQMTMDDLREFSAFVQEFVTAVREGKKAGQTVDQIAEAWKVPAKYTGYAAAQPEGVKRNVQVIFDEIR